MDINFICILFAIHYNDRQRSTVVWSGLKYEWLLASQWSKVGQSHSGHFILKELGL